MQITKPTFILDQEIVKSNIRLMAEKALKEGVRFRPHFKTHQSVMVGEWFREAGIQRITVSSLTMARFFASAGWSDITVAFPVNLAETDMINQLAAECRLGVLVEDSEVLGELLKRIDNPIDIYIKIDCGYHRTGLQIEQTDEILNIARMAADHSKARFKGILTHAGHTYGASGPSEIRKIAYESIDYMGRVRALLNDFGECLISYGDTPSCSVLESFSGLDEIRPGNFVFYDLMQFRLGSCSFGQIGGVVACPVVAVHPSRNQAVIYGGAVHLSKDRILIDDRQVFGQMVVWNGSDWGEPIAGAYLVSLSQEHGILEADQKVIETLKPGQVIGVVPVHSCLTANLMRGYCLKDGKPVDHMQGI
jgi:D-serine deaminase-like pyridoxal phosphate-dependent protein